MLGSSRQSKWPNLNGKREYVKCGTFYYCYIRVVGIASIGGKLAVKGSNALEEAQDARKAVDNVIDGTKGTDKLEQRIEPIRIND